MLNSLNTVLFRQFKSNTTIGSNLSSTKQNEECIKTNSYIFAQFLFDVALVKCSLMQFNGVNSKECKCCSITSGVPLGTCARIPHAHRKYGILAA